MRGGSTPSPLASTSAMSSMPAASRGCILKGAPAASISALSVSPRRFFSNLTLKMPRTVMPRVPPRSSRQVSIPVMPSSAIACTCEAGRRVHLSWSAWRDSMLSPYSPGRVEMFCGSDIEEKHHMDSYWSGIGLDQRLAGTLRHR
jgi:hypothetical protein